MVKKIQLTLSQLIDSKSRNKVEQIAIDPPLNPIDSHMELIGLNEDSVSYWRRIESDSTDDDILFIG